MMCYCCYCLVIVPTGNIKSGIIEISQFLNPPNTVGIVNKKDYNKNKR